MSINSDFNVKSMPSAYRKFGLDDQPHLLRPFVVESHARCEYLGLKPFESCDHFAQSSADFKITLERNARLITHATSVLTMLGKHIADFGSLVVLTDNTGTILRTQCQSSFVEQAEKVSLRPGVNWSESTKGTNAVGTALVLESSTFVNGEEHFFQSKHFLSCAASPVMDHTGNVIGILDASGEKRCFHPHTMALVEMCARTIENNWFRDKFSQTLQLHFHTMPELIGTAEEGTIAVGEDGKVLGVNRAALKILDCSAATLRIKGLQGLFGVDFREFIEKLRHPSCFPLKLYYSNVKEIFVRISWNGKNVFSSAANLPLKPVPQVADFSGPAMTEPGALPVEKMTTFLLDELDTGDATYHLLAQKIRHVVDHDISILIIGETGTGKELLAKAIHQFSRRRNQPFVAINCASIPEQLIESELFGYESGTFTGASAKGKPGMLSQANGGTLFLDEIGDMPLLLQARLLRVLQERKVVPLGGRRAIDIDVNLICATHRNLREQIEQKSFRDDLYYRINGMSVKLPPLRDRTDLAQLCKKILQELSPHRPLPIQPALMSSFARYSWPGNIRQLNNVLKTASVMAKNEHEITLDHLADDFREELAMLAPPGLPNPDMVLASAQASTILPLPGSSDTGEKLQTHMPTPLQTPGNHSLEQMEFTAIKRVLDACGGNVSTASRQLHISRNTIYRRLKKSA